MSGNYRGPSATILADNNNIDGDKGDITVSNSGAEWTIDANVVTYAKMQQASTTDVLIGRATSGAGDLEEIPLTAAGRALLDDANAAAQRTTLGLNALVTDSNLQGFVDAFTLPTVDGTIGQVLSTDGAGNLTLVAPGGVPDGDKGDITVSGTGTIWTIDNDSVTYAKIQNVSATDKLLGRSTAGSGDIEEISCTSAGRDLLDDVDASAQRSTLGLGGASVLNVGTTAGTVAAGDDSRINNGQTAFGWGDHALAGYLEPADIGVTVQGYDVDTAKTDVLQTFTASQRGTVTTDNDLSFDMSVTNNFTCTPTAGGALTFTNITAGQSGYILLVNGSNYAITAAATTKVGSSFLATVSVTGTYLISYFSNGTNVYCTASGALS